MDIRAKGIAQPNTCLSRTGNRISIEHGTFKAGNSHRINLDWRVWNPEGKDLVSVLYRDFEQHLRTRKNKPLQRVSAAYRDAMSSVIASASHAMNRGTTIRYSRRGRSRKTVVEVVDYLQQRELLINTIGRDNQWQGNESWAYPTNEFMLELERAKIRVGLADGAPFLIIRDSKGKQKTFKQNTPKAQRLSRPVSAYNDMWLGHVAMLDDQPVIPFCVRICNESFDYGGRFYRATHLTEPKSNRARILIDGEETIEPDFKYLHFALMYWWEGMELESDPYVVDGFSRDTIKLVNLVLVNSENLAAFKRNVTKSGNPANKSLYAAYKSEYEDFLLKLRNGAPAQEPYKPKLLEGFMEGMPDFINGADVLEAIRKRHPRISHHFGTEKIGLKLQRQDSDIMAGCLGALAHLDIPVLPVHDSIRCKVSDLEIVAKVMSESYQSVTGFKPRIDY